MPTHWSSCFGIIPRYWPSPRHSCPGPSTWSSPLQKKPADAATNSRCPRNAKLADCTCRSVRGSTRLPSKRNRTRWSASQVPRKNAEDLMPGSESPCNTNPYQRDAFAWSYPSRRIVDATSGRIVRARWWKAKYARSSRRSSIAPGRRNRLPSPEDRNTRSGSPNKNEKKLRSGRAGRPRWCRPGAAQLTTTATRHSPMPWMHGGRPAKSASFAPLSTKPRLAARSQGKPNSCGPGSSGDTRSPTAWIHSAVHLVSPTRASTRIQPQTTCALTSGTGVPIAPKRSITGLKPNSEHRSAMHTAKAGCMDAEVGLNGGGDSVTLAGPQF